SRRRSSAASPSCGGSSDSCCDAGKASASTPASTAVDARREAENRGKLRVRGGRAAEERRSMATVRIEVWMAAALLAACSESGHGARSADEPDASGAVPDASGAAPDASSDAPGIQSGTLITLAGGQVQGDTDQGTRR